MLQRLVLAVLLLTMAAPKSESYTRMTSRGGVPLRRTDTPNIQFLVNSATAAGMTNSASFPIITSSSDPMAALKAAAGTWNLVSSSAVHFASLGVTERENNPSDGINVIVFLDKQEVRDAVGTALAITTVQYFVDSGRIFDTDILFNPNLKINGQAASFSTTQEQNTFDIQSIATHEMGHSLGANHSTVLGATMFQATRPGVIIQSRLSSDDLAFVTEAYPATGVDTTLGSITGKISFTAGAPVRRASVIAISSATGVAVSGISGADGLYAINRIPPGDYLVYAEPLAGAVMPENLNLSPTDVDSSFKIDFFGGVASPRPVRVSGGGVANADIAVSEGAPPFKIQFMGSGVAGNEESFSRFSLSPISLKAGEALDLMVVGPGIDETLTQDQIRLLGPITIRPGSLHFPRGVTVSGMPVARMTVDVGARADCALASLLVIKGGAVSAFSAGLVIVPSVPNFAPNGVVNAASFTGGSVSPGEIAAVFGTAIGPSLAMINAGLDPQTGLLPALLAGVKVTFDGVPAPLFYVSSGQINLQVPYEIAGHATTSVQIEFQRIASAKVEIPVVAATPGLFVFPGTSRAIVVNQDGSLNSPSRPAAAGSWITIYATGQGTVSPPLATGQPAPSSPLSIASGVSVTIGGLPATLLFGGMTPEMAGLFQVNVIVPEGVTPGGAVPLQVRVNGASSQPGVTIAVQ